MVRSNRLVIIYNSTEFINQKNVYKNLIKLAYLLIKFNGNKILQPLSKRLRFIKNEEIKPIQINISFSRQNK